MTAHQVNERRFVIFTGGDLGEWALAELELHEKGRNRDFLLGTERGALFLLQNGMTPDLAIGDFDSVTVEERDEIKQRSRQFIDCDPVLKDYTDTEMAVEWAIRHKPREITLLGATGSRLDHTLANIHLLHKCDQVGIPCRIVNEKNELRLLSGTGELTVQNGRFTYLSLLPLSMNVSGITLNGFRYPLERATLNIGQSLGISNILTGAEGQIQVESGQLLVIQSMD